LTIRWFSVKSKKLNYNYNPRLDGTTSAGPNVDGTESIVYESLDGKVEKLSTYKVGGHL
jgi:hypothetical protein